MRRSARKRRASHTPNQLCKRIINKVKKNFLRKLNKYSHKYSHGTVAVIAGSLDFAGASLLCVGGARRGGSGYINYVHEEESLRNLVVSTYPDVVAREKVK